MQANYIPITALARLPFGTTSVTPLRFTPVIKESHIVSSEKWISCLRVLLTCMSCAGNRVRARRGRDTFGIFATHLQQPSPR